MHLANLIKFSYPVCILTQNIFIRSEFAHLVYNSYIFYYSFDLFYNNLNSLAHQRIERYMQFFVCLFCFIFVVILCCFFFLSVFLSLLLLLFFGSFFDYLFACLFVCLVVCLFFIELCVCLGCQLLTNIILMALRSVTHKEFQ